MSDPFDRTLPFDIEEDVTAEDVRALEERMYEFNVQATGIADGRGLVILLRDAEGQIQAGLNGHTWGRCCEILQVWIDDSLRGQGLGRRMLEAAEAEARSRGCAQIVLNTHSFQAPGFYQKLGFEIVYDLRGYPEGHSELLLIKRLEPETG